MGVGRVTKKIGASWRKAIPNKALRVTLTILFAGMVLVMSVPLPRALFEAPLSTTLRVSNGELLSASIAQDGQWRFPASDSIPFRFATAIRFFEDEDFYAHPGIDPAALVRAAYLNIRAGRVVSGGSTISMQTMRLAYGNAPRTYLQKMMEMTATLKLELLYSKKDILKLYADHCPFGGNIVGINAASWRYFGRPPEKLSWAESAALAILPNNPGSIFPGKNQEQFLKKRNRLLDKLYANGYLDTDELLLSKDEPLPLKVKPLPDVGYHLLHRSMEEGYFGKNVVSTLDAALQREVSRRVNDYSAQMKANQVHNAAAVVIEISSGNTLAYVGNTSNEGDHGQHVDIVTAQRSPGSLLKPVLYAASLDEGLILPRQLLPDIPVFYKGFSPKNFDKTYRGAVPADEALAASLNVPFVHLLIGYGYERFHQKLKDMGMRSLNQPAGHYGLSIILGGAETSLWELTAIYAGMVRAYSNLPGRPYRKGYAKADYHPNRYVADANNEEEVALEDDGFLRAPSIGYALQAMQEVRRPTEEAGWQMFRSSRPIAWKTGTSFGFRDGWAIGMNSRYLVGVWLGNADGEGRPGLTGVQAAAPLMFDLFDLLQGDASFDEVYGSPVALCAQSGMLATEQCPPAKTTLNLPDYMSSGRSCAFHQLVHLDSDEKFQVNSSCYEVARMKTVTRFVLPPVQGWYYRRYHPAYQNLPPFRDQCTSSEKQKLLALIYPAQYTRVHIPVEQDGVPGSAIFEATHENNSAKLYWHLDEEYLGVTERHHQMAIRARAGKHVITLVDDAGNELRQGFEVVQ
jgi:penicillin-binding protein 1C